MYKIYTWNFRIQNTRDFSVLKVGSNKKYDKQKVGHEKLKLKSF